MKTFGGPVLFLDRSDINTDEIIPAKYLTESTKEALEPYLLEDLDLRGFAPSRDIPHKRVIITRANFGCGSSREHAPWALEVNDMNVVVAESFARIFRQNMYNCGMLALELEKEAIDRLFREFAGSNCELAVDIDAQAVTISSRTATERCPITLGKFEEALVRAGGWVEYADANY